MKCEHEQQAAMLKKIQEIQFVAVELNLYLDTHPCDEEALRDYQCAVERLQELICEYEQVYGPILNFGHGGCCNAGKGWQWASGPWPWEL
ncbi:spore coat protein CotJB [Acetonema longum]|uniref:Protein CotJB domain-containing protein n=1 Tax=Acetonema longum DSM 6540 TaxID=1009370 RepID=F7NI75_9FIRM|nr:spore coat protein CotJB [Acetonema longum]EGO64256.1 hypothetical protein ALO_08867 [Acetonema longum DSM 6540]